MNIYVRKVKICVMELLQVEKRYFMIMATIQLMVQNFLESKFIKKIYLILNNEWIEIILIFMSNKSRKKRHKLRYFFTIKKVFKLYLSM